MSQSVRANTTSNDNGTWTASVSADFETQQEANEWAENLAEKCQQSDVEAPVTDSNTEDEQSTDSEQSEPTEAPETQPEDLVNEEQSTNEQ